MEEEKTESMASQFSSSDVVEDIFSKLPEHIIHCILGFLPSTKDVVRTSAISKSWLRAWLTFPISEFNLEDFVSQSSIFSGEEDEAKNKQFIGFVDSTLQRFERQNRDGNGNRMKIFNLSTVNEMAHHHGARWIGIALDNQVEHLALRILVYLYSELLISIPDRLFSAYWLKSLKLDGPTIHIPLTEDSRVDLPSLTCLHIRYYIISNEKLQKLLSGCPALEEIALTFCHSLSKVDIFYHPNLETLQVCLSRNRTRADHSAITVRAPKLKSFDYTDIEGDAVVNILNSPELKSLRICDSKKTDEWFHKFIAQFPLIEDLIIDWCCALRNIRISNPLLEKIIIDNCNLEDVVISCEKLASLILLTRGYSIPKPSIKIEMDNPPDDCTAHITVEPSQGECGLLMGASWYCKMKEFLSGPVTFKSLIICVEGVCIAEDGCMKEEDVRKKLPPTACNIEMLRLRVDTISSCFSHILNGLLSACHPTTIMLDALSSDEFVELVCKELGKRENNSRCWCKDDFKCWKHQLKKVKIEKIAGIKLEEDLDWDALFDLLPNLEDGNDIYFELMW